MNIIKCVLLGRLVLAVSLLFSLAPLAAWSAETENHCFSCHTNPRKLSEITRKIAKVDQHKPGGSIETTGEG